MGLLSPIERKTSWQLSEAVKQQTPYSLPHLLDPAHQDADTVRDDIRAYSVEHLGQPDAVLVLAETGFLKKGRRSPLSLRRWYI